MKTKHCDNQFCETEVTKPVSVSVHGAGDLKRNVCEACYEVYCIGVQHGRLSESPKAYSNSAPSRSR